MTFKHQLFTFGMVAMTLIAVGHDANAATNVALMSNGGVANSSDNSVDPNNAIDGSTNGAFGSGSVWEDIFNPNGPRFWEVTLGDYTGMELQSIVLFNRDDCCDDRLSDFLVEVFDGSDNVLFSFDNDTIVPHTAGEQSLPTAGLEILLPGGIDDATRVRLTDQSSNQHFHVAEAQVFAEIPEPASLALLGLGGLLVLRRNRQ